MRPTLQIGIDLGGTNCRGAVVAYGSHIQNRQHMPTLITEGQGHFLGRFLPFCRDLVQAAACEGALLQGLGIGVPGVISGEGRVVVSPNLPALDGLHLRDLLQQELGLPVRVVNDANAAAWGEAILGAGQSFNSFLTVTLGTGVGGGLVLDRRLWVGADGAAGEVGHLVVDPEGRPCRCGSRGCLEQYASAAGVIATLRESILQGEASILARIPESDLSPERIAAAAAAGDGPALRALGAAGRSLGLALAGITNLLNLDAAVVGGGLAPTLELMRPALEEELRARAFPLAARRLRVVRGALGDDAGILGAALRAGLEKAEP